MKIRHFLHSSLGAAVILLAAHGPVFATSLPEAETQARDAYALLAKGEFAQAVAAYSRVIDAHVLAPDAQLNALMNRALAEQRLGQAKASTDDYSAALAMPAISADLRVVALYNRGLGYHTSKDLPRAIEDYTAALMAKPELPQAYFARGQALRESGQLLFAVSDFERALKFGHPDPGRVNFLAALTFEQLQRTVEARKAYAAALAANPAMTKAQQRLAALGGPLAATEQVAAKSAQQEAATASLDVVKETLPKPVEPGTALLEPAKAPDAAMAQSEAPAPTAKKLYTDRIPPTEDLAKPAAVETVSSTTEITGSVTPAPEEPVQSRETFGPDTGAGNWAVQLVSAASEAAASAGWEKMKKKYKVLEGYEPKILRADLGKKGIMYRVRLLGYTKQGEAAAVCKKLHGKGVPCYVSNIGS